MTIFHRPIYPRTLLTLLLWNLLTAVTTFLFIKHYYIAGIIGVIIWIEGAKRLYKLFTKNNSKMTFLLDAIENSDYNFKYTTQGVSEDEKQVNLLLNRIVEIMTKAKLNAQQREKYYELILDAVNTGVVVIDNKGFVYQRNKEALRLLGMTIFTHITQLKRIDENLYETFDHIKGGEKKNISFQQETGTTTLSIHAASMNLQGTPVRLLALNDIKSELDEKEIDSWIRLTRVLTHEIMNSVTPITSLSETLLKRVNPQNKELKTGLETIRSTGSGLILFVENYRKFTHIATPVPSLFYVKNFAVRMRQLSLHLITAGNITITIDVQPADLIVYADENLISHVALNLLKNAIQAIGTTQQDGIIILKAYCDANEAVIIKISNNGPLIPPEEQEHIFVPFFTTKHDGSGIGLSISRQIMRLSGGSLTLQSDTKRHITTFTLKFP